MSGCNAPCVSYLLLEVVQPPVQNAAPGVRQVIHCSLQRNGSQPCAVGVCWVLHRHTHVDQLVVGLQHTVSSTK